VLISVQRYGRPSNSVSTITDALRELSANTIARTPAGQPVKKVIVKLVYDRGTLEQVSDLSALNNAPIWQTNGYYLDLERSRAGSHFWLGSDENPPSRRGAWYRPRSSGES